MKVLLVDDSKVSRAVTAAYLLEMGYPAIEAGDGESALAMYREHNPDVILLDVEMPGMDGYATAHAIRRTERSNNWTPIIFLSGRVADEDIARGIDAGGDDYISKPVRPVVLRAKLLAMSRIAEMRNKLMEMSQQLQDVNRTLAKLCSQDGLTGIANRRAFDAAIEREWKRGLNQNYPIALILTDVDFFKRYNDHYGHQAGDNCLRMVAGALAGRARRVNDVAARFGGEEFALLLPETSVPEALSVANELLESVRALAIPHAKSEVAAHVTTSVGVAVTAPSTEFSWDLMLRTADRALYQAKSEGRNRLAFQQLGAH
jgi:diguanylate cyclase (GGDEF)-like protein